MAENNIKDFKCPLANQMCFPAVQEAAKIIGNYRQKQAEKDRIKWQMFENMTIVNSIITALVAMVLISALLCYQPMISNKSGLIVTTAIIATFPVALYKIERWCQ